MGGRRGGKEDERGHRHPSASLMLCNHCKFIVNHLLIKVFAGLIATALCSFGQGFLVVNTGFTTGGQFISFDGSTGTLGYQFTVGADSVYALSLGVCNWNEEGLNNSHEVGLWDLQGNLLASTIIAAGSNTNQFVYSTVTPVLLKASETYIIGASYIGHDSDLIGLSDSDNNGSPTYNSAVTFDADRYDASLSGLTFPTMTDFPEWLGEFGPNAEIEVVPEPTTDTLLGLSGLLLFCRRIMVSRWPNTALKPKPLRRFNSIHFRNSR
jgi:hypothetical protein